MKERHPFFHKEDGLILMHRECHFGGQFPLMIDYYSARKVGVSEFFSLKRIEQLAKIESSGQENLASLLLSEEENQKIARVHELYRQLRSCYGECEEQSHPRPKSDPELIADLILTEDAEPRQEIDAVVAEGSQLVPALLKIIRDEDFYDPLFPGYGLAPTHALACLERIGDPRALTALFELIGSEDFFHEDLAITSLHRLGKKASHFLLTIAGSRPINGDNERAAIALVAFKEDPEIAREALSLLASLPWRSHLLLATYLILACEGLCDPKDRETFIALAKNPEWPKELRHDHALLIKGWRTSS